MTTLSCGINLRIDKEVLFNHMGKKVVICKLLLRQNILALYLNNKQNCLKMLSNMDLLVQSCGTPLNMKRNHMDWGMCFYK